MSYLPLANILHRKLRSALCMLAVAIGIAMLVVMLGLSHGTLNEVAERMESVPAELLVLPPGENFIYLGGGYFGPGHEKLIRETTVDGKPIVRDVIPVYCLTNPLGGQKQRIFGVRRDELSAIFGSHKLVEGRLFDAHGRFERAVAARAGPHGGYDTDAMPADELAPGLEIVIDQRLQRVGGFHVGDEVPLLGRTFTIVGVVETGVAARVFAPIETLRHVDASGLHKATMFFVRLGDPALAPRAAAQIETDLGAQVIEKSAYRDILYESFQQIYVFINVASGLALVVCFIIILLTMYTLVLERTREIGILRSLGATRRYIVRLAMEESLILCGGGTALGIAASYAAKYAIERALPLQTVELTWQWVALAVGVGLVGGIGSAIYPGYRAAKLDPAMALNFD